MHHVYFRHLSTKYRSILLTDMVTDSQLIYPPILSRYISPDSTECRSRCFFELKNCGSTLSVGMSADTQSICCDPQSLVYRLTVGDVSVDYRWYWNIVDRCFAEIVAISLPTEDAKEEPIAYACVLITQGCSSNIVTFYFYSQSVFSSESIFFFLEFIDSHVTI